jgi:hypothetical protein
MAETQIELKFIYERGMKFCATDEQHHYVTAMTLIRDWATHMIVSTAMISRWADVGAVKELFIDMQDEMRAVARQLRVRHRGRRARVDLRHSGRVHRQASRSHPPLPQLASERLRSDTRGV